MGSCLSSFFQTLPPSPPSVKVISLLGDLHEYPASLLVSHVLQAETSSSSSSSSSPAFFLCNSDRLYYDDHIPPLDSDEQLRPNQIYFVLPTSKLQHHLTASDMAALAVKASLALQTASTDDKKTRRRKQARISPFVIAESNERQLQSTGKKSSQNSDGRPVKISRSSSVRTFQRLTSRSRMAVRSFRLRLSTIYEGSIQ